MMQHVIISEPWNFKSSAGENELLVKYLRTEKKGMIYKCESNFDDKTTYLLFTARGNTGEYNIYILGNDAFDIDSKNLKLSMIGRFE